MVTVPKFAELCAERFDPPMTRDQFQATISNATKWPERVQALSQFLMGLGIACLSWCAIISLSGETLETVSLGAGLFLLFGGCLGPVILQTNRWVTLRFRRNFDQADSQLLDILGLFKSGELTAKDLQSGAVDASLFDSAFAVLLFSADEKVRRLVKASLARSYPTQLEVLEPDWRETLVQFSQELEAGLANDNEVNQSEAETEFEDDGSALSWIAKLSETQREVGLETLSQANPNLTEKKLKKFKLFMEIAFSVYEKNSEARNEKVITAAKTRFKKDGKSTGLTDRDSEKWMRAVLTGSPGTYYWIREHFSK